MYTTCQINLQIHIFYLFFLLTITVKFMNKLFKIKMLQKSYVLSQRKTGFITGTLLISLILLIYIMYLYLLSSKTLSLRRRKQNTKGFAIILTPSHRNVRQKHMKKVINKKVK